MIIGLATRAANKESGFRNLKLGIMKKNLFLGLAISGLLFFSSCGPSEVTVSTRPQPPYYARPVSPGVDYVWIDGDWVARGGRYHWREGHWRNPGTRVWVSGSWQSRNNGWYWERGHWR
jgi:YXWGXW repeat-containing protein